MTANQATQANLRINTAAPFALPSGGLDGGLKSLGQNRPIATFAKGRDTKKNATRSAPVLVEKVLQARRHFAALGASASKLVANARPALGGVYGHDPRRFFQTALREDAIRAPYRS
jgi:hypothetical protein